MEGNRTVVMRPPVEGESIPIPNTEITEMERKEIIDRQKRASATKSNLPRIKTVENTNLKIQVIDSTRQISENEMKGNDKMEWTEVRKKKGRKKGENETEEGKRTTGEEGKRKQQVQNINHSKSKDKDKGNNVKRKIPKTAAISIKGSTKEFSYADALRKARSKISLKELNITMPKIRKGRNGATIIGITGDDNAVKADALANKIQEILKDKALVTRPTIRGELKLTELEESITEDEIRWVIAQEGSCKSEEVKVNSIRTTRSGLNIAWLKCPIQVAIDISKIGKVKVGWTVVKAELLKSRPMQCFRCWKIRHVRDKCN